MRIIYFCFAGLLTLPLFGAIKEPIKVEGGLISGTPGWGTGIREYLGIPFAAPPVGNLRWQPPQPVTPWQGVKEADRFAAACAQRKAVPGQGAWNRGLINTSEDCLYINVWTPAAASTDKLPVLVWIYGGGGISGSTAEPTYDGNSVAKKGVVVVSMGYRLGVFGWLAHPELTKESPHHASGNYGSLDQLAGIQWVKNNIAQFGGDPDKVTIWGESGGSRSVNFLTASPLLKGLARGAIAESHTTFGRMLTLQEAEANGVNFGKTIGKNSLAELRATPAKELVEAALKTPRGLNGAIVDGWFLPQDIYTMYAQGKQNDIPLITGGTNDEGGNIAGIGSDEPPPTPTSLATYTAWAKQTFGAKADTLLKLYPATSDAQALEAYHDVYRDINFAGHRTWAKLQSTTGKAPAWIYIFSHNPPLPVGSTNNARGEHRAVHFSETIYVFNNLRMRDLPYTDVDRKVADTLATYWTNFAKTGNPNGANLTNWPVYNPKDEFWLNFGDTTRLERFNSAGVDFIASVQEELRRGH